MRKFYRNLQKLPKSPTSAPKDAQHFEETPRPQRLGKFYAAKAKRSEAKPLTLLRRHPLRKQTGCVF